MHNRLIPIIDATSLDKYICILYLSSKRKCTASCMTDYINGVKIVSTKLNKLGLSCAKLSLALASYLLFLVVVGVEVMDGGGAESFSC